MGNQQAKTGDCELYWLAGFVDGEGSFNLHRNKQRRWTGYQPWFTLGNTDIATLDIVADILGKAGIAYHVGWYNDRRPDRKKLWRISITGLKRVQRWIALIEPYLKTKRRQALLLQEFVELRLSNTGWRTGLSEAEAALIPQLRVMNHQDASQTTRETDLIKSDGIVEPAGKPVG